MSGRLEGKVAIVTGASRGYGQGIAAVLAEEGARVWMTARSKEPLLRAAEEVGGVAVPADVGLASDWDRILEEAMGAAGRIDILVNNAGAGITVKHLDEQSDEDVDHSVAINLVGAIYGCRRVARQMKAQKEGSIINISSVCAVEAWPGYSVYSAAKAGLLQLSRCLHTELRPFGVRVTCLMPSWGVTNFLQAMGKPDRDQQIKAKTTQPRELGRVVADLCTLPAHLVVQEMVLWPMVQEVIPL